MTITNSEDCHLRERAAAVIPNGMYGHQSARLLPENYPQFFSRARGTGLGGADVALVIGVPLDFRLGFGASFSPEAEIIAIDSAEPERDHPRPVAAELFGAGASRRKVHLRMNQLGLRLRALRGANA